MNHPACCFTALVLLTVASAAIGQESAPPAGVAPRVQVGLGAFARDFTTARPHCASAFRAVIGSIASVWRAGR